MLKERDENPHAQREQDQCLSEGPTGRCPFEKIEGTDHCAKHSGRQSAEYAKKEALYKFKKESILAADMEKQAMHKYDLSGELAVLRTILQQYIDQIQTFQDLSLYDSRIAHTIDKIQKVSDQVLKADQKLGTLMSEDDALALAQNLLDVVHSILSDHIADKNEFAAAMEDAARKFTDVLEA